MRAQDLGLRAGSPVTSSWCLSSWRDVIAALDPVAATDPRLLLWEDGALSVYYAPWDWVNTIAKVMLVGITPGAYQATEALREAQARLRAGRSSEETLRRADAAGSFSGPMRTHLVTMLDGIGVADTSSRHRMVPCMQNDFRYDTGGHGDQGGCRSGWRLRRLFR
jgi:hypothetical protein